MSITSDFTEIPPPSDERDANEMWVAAEIADHFRVNYRTVIRWFKDGFIEAYPLPGRGNKPMWRCTTQQLQDFMDRVLAGKDAADFFARSYRQKQILKSQELRECYVKRQRKRKKASE